MSEESLKKHRQSMKLANQKPHKSGFSTKYFKRIQYKRVMNEQRLQEYKQKPFSED